MSSTLDDDLNLTPCVTASAPKAVRSVASICDSVAGAIRSASTTPRMPPARAREPSGSVAGWSRRKASTKAISAGCGLRTR
ncbi:MAG: hypothetical protein IPN17_06015 [Deltaproteobacteria bacterium]|nr:hypothetical protein [Deltaproteobacteria bacterium]